MSDDLPSPVPIPLAVFGAMLKPQLTGTSTMPVRKPGDTPHVIKIYSQGHADEIWLKMLQIKHGIERHTVEGWHALIAHYKTIPAHPADPNYVPGV